MSGVSSTLIFLATEGTLAMQRMLIIGTKRTVLMTYKIALRQGIETLTKHDLSFPQPALTPTPIAIPTIETMVTKKTMKIGVNMLGYCVKSLSIVKYSISTLKKTRKE